MHISFISFFEGACQRLLLFLASRCFLPCPIVVLIGIPCLQSGQSSAEYDGTSKTAKEEKGAPIVSELIFIESLLTITQT